MDNLKTANSLPIVISFRFKASAASGMGFILALNSCYLYRKLKMNNIPSTQNELKHLQQLAAQRELYTSAKTYQLFQFLVNLLIPILLSVLILEWAFLIPYAALYGIVAAMLDPLFFDTAIQRRREKAAKVQELFDCEVLELKNSPLKMSTADMIEEVLVEYDAHSKIRTNIEKIKDWYPKAIEVLPMHIARLVCQRTNCYWDSRLRKRYANFIRYFGICTFILFLFIGLISNKSFPQIVLIASGLLPFIQFSLKQYKDQSEAAKRLDKLVNYAKEIWENDLNKSINEIDELSRRLQDEIYVHRSKSPLILNFIYKRFRKKDEKIMNNTADALVENAKKRGLF